MPAAVGSPASTRPSTVARQQDAGGGQTITFAEYRDFRLRDIARRQARLARELAADGLSPAQRSDLEGRKAYYEELAAMSAAERDRLFRARFDQIDTDHDGTIDAAERAQWRTRQRERYRDAPALARTADDPGQR